MNNCFRRGYLRVSTIVAVALTVGCFCLAVSLVPALADDKQAAETAKASDCTRCHTCAKPVAENVCLPDCTRIQAAAEEMTKKKGPDFVLLDMIKSEEEGVDRFGPSPFDHLAHAKWAELTDGCVLCHHYTPEGTTHPACNTCHPSELLRDDISKPSLKGAYHRQCMGCHREWSHNTKCDACHIKKTGKDRGVITPEQALINRVDPLPEPEVEVYLSEFPTGVGSEIKFHHRRHVQAYGLTCVECHRGDSCARCHEGESKKKTTKRAKPRTPTEAHRACVLCHEGQIKAEKGCDHCHMKKGTPMPKPFDHAGTGWPLTRYHKDNVCRACHTAGPFVKLDRECNACHSDWEPDTFDHTVTGQGLDENHEEIGCGDCHIDHKFDVTPKCDECHEENEGFIFPKKRPGPVVKLKPAVKG